MYLLLTILGIDKELTSLIFSLPSSTLPITLMRFFSFEGAFILIWLVIFVFIYKKYFAQKHTSKVFVELFIVLLIVNTIINVAIKPLFARPRPLANQAQNYPTPQSFLINLFTLPPLDDHKPPITASYPHDFSFPSGHAALAYAAALYLGLRDRKRLGVYVFLADIIAFSRVYLGYHYVLDVVGGALIGITSVYVFMRLLKLNVVFDNNTES